MYATTLIIHSWLRWASLLLGIAATINAARPVAYSHNKLPGRWWDTFFMLVVDLQVLFGLVLYFGLSPLTRVAMEDVSAAITVPAVRFWAIEHTAAMFAAVVLVRMGRVMAMNAVTAAAARRRRLVCFALATALMAIAIPWPGLPNGRPWIRWRS